MAQHVEKSVKFPAISADELGAMRSQFASDAAAHVAQRAVTTNGLYKAAEGMSAVEAHSGNTFQFSIDVDSEDVANQKKSGRCWMFAALNVLRQHLQKTRKVPADFELSQSYLFFYDKLEKSNYFYDNMIELADRPMSDPLLRHRLSQPQQDGGDWCMMTALIDKYGVVPKDQMGESAVSSDSAELDTVLNRKLRKDAYELRKMVASLASDEELAQARSRMLAEDYRILAIALGEPPATIRFEYREADSKEFHQSQKMTPQEFYKEYIGLDLNDFIVLQDFPNAEYGKLYGIEMSGNMIGGRPNLYLNVPVSQMKQAVIKQLKDGYGVWHSSDVMQQFDRAKGIMDTDLYDFSSLLGVDIDMPKKDLFDYQESLPTHGMVIAGVDVVDGQPTRWKVENSWGSEIGAHGYMIMSDAWMDAYTYGVAVNKKYLTDQQRAALEKEPEILPFWNTANPILGR